MKKYVVSSLAALALVAGSVFLSPLSASADTYVPTDPCSCGTSTVKVPDGAIGAGLADTGSSVPMWLLGGAGAAVVAGGVVLVARRRSRSAD